MLIATVLAIVAMVFLWRGNLSPAFVIGALGAVAWFLSYRSQRAEHASVEDVSHQGAEFDDED